MGLRVRLYTPTVTIDEARSTLTGLMVVRTRRKAVIAMAARQKPQAAKAAGKRNADGHR